MCDFLYGRGFSWLLNLAVCNVKFNILNVQKWQSVISDTPIVCCFYSFRQCQRRPFTMQKTAFDMPMGHLLRHVLPYIATQ